MFLYLGKPKSINSLRNLQKDYDKIDRSRIKIIIIDDEDFNYQKVLQDHDFNIKKLNDIQDIKAVSEYDIIISDIKGIGKTFNSNFEGAHIISEIKKIYPSKFVIAYSGHLLDTSFNEHLRKADLVLKKDIDSDTWIENLDKSISLIINPIYQWQRIRNYLIQKEVDLFYIQLLEDDYVTKIIKKDQNFPSNKLAKCFSKEIWEILKGFAGNLLFKILIG